jgi:hypothetical protein
VGGCGTRVFDNRIILGNPVQLLHDRQEAGWSLSKLLQNVVHNDVRNGVRFETPPSLLQIHDDVGRAFLGVIDVDKPRDSLRSGAQVQLQTLFGQISMNQCRGSCFGQREWLAATLYGRPRRW